MAGGWRSPTQAVYVFATQYINWNSQDVSARLRALARVSVGQARSAVSAAASETDPMTSSSRVRSRTRAWSRRSRR